MKSDPKNQQQYEDEQELFENRLREQEQNKDYDWNEKGEREKCDDCGNNLNSHGHCNRCDY